MDVIMSVRPEYVDKIVMGEKTIEVRVKRPNLNSEDVIWIYEKLPRGHISVRASVDCVITLSIESAWRRYKREIGISLDEYRNYIKDRHVVSLILLKEVRILSRPLTLGKLRERNSRFTPPQFMHKVKEAALMKELGRSI